MSVRNHDDDPFGQKQDDSSFNVDNLESEITDSSFLPTALFSDTEDNYHALNNELAPSNHGVGGFKYENLFNGEIIVIERNDIQGESNDVSKPYETEYEEPYSAENDEVEEVFKFDRTEQSINSGNYKMTKSNSLKFRPTLKSGTERVIHSAATSPYPCRTVHKKSVNDAGTIPYPKPSLNSFIMDDSINDDDDDTIYSNNSISISTESDLNDSVQLVIEPLQIPPPPPLSPTRPPPVYYERHPPGLHRYHMNKNTREENYIQLNQQYQQQIEQEPPPPPPASVNNRMRIKNETIPTSQYYRHPFLLPRVNSNDSIDSNNGYGYNYNNNNNSMKATVVHVSCRCESGNCSNGNCSCLKSGVECNSDCYCRLKGKTCENGKEKRERKMSQPKTIKCSCTKAGCRKGKCSCRKNNLHCGKDCSCTCNLRKVFI